ncbi:MAG TPA: hypothetical protein VM120_23145 [Bryobacteraceae bacterium]|nr:hypothetical protein [Bryobacteraceae bacterium]
MSLAIRSFLFLCWIVAPVQGADSRRLIAGVKKTIDKMQPSEAELRFDRIAWVPDIRTAIRLAGLANRPVLLLSHDGRMSTGRC